MKHLLPAIAIVGILTMSASATTIDPLTFEERVLGADFVGIVECEQAGGIVAMYRVIESLKGPKSGTIVSIRVAVNYWEPQFPISFCGERFFVTAYKEAPIRIMSTTSGGGVPLWWRQIPADYGLPLFQGRSYIAPGEERGEEFRKMFGRAKMLVGLKPAGQESELLKSLADKELFSIRWEGGERDEEKAKALRERIEKLATVEEVIGELLQLVKNDRQKWSDRVQVALAKGSRNAALELLRKLPAAQQPWDAKSHAALVQAIESRLALAKDPPDEEDRQTAKTEKPNETQLQKLRADFAAGPDSRSFGDAFEQLTKYDPAPVLDYLVAWKNPKKEWSDEDQGYVLGSYFAWRCGVNRVKYLRALLKANDPYIRVAGAVYLCFEDAEAGKAELRKFTSIEGDPGVWAALTLTRRGEKSAITRVLTVFRELPKAETDRKSGMALVPHGNLEKRVLVLLSNSAHASSAPQFSLPEKHEQWFDYLTRWWNDNAVKISLTDPWLQTFEKQKVD